MTQIKAKKDLYNHGKCFTKGEIYTIGKPIYMESSLMDCVTLNDQGEKHTIGSWWRNFKIIIVKS